MVADGRPTGTNSNTSPAVSIVFVDLEHLRSCLSTAVLVDYCPYMHTRLLQALSVCMLLVWECDYNSIAIKRSLCHDLNQMWQLQ